MSSPADTLHHALLGLETSDQTPRRLRLESTRGIDVELYRRRWRVWRSMKHHGRFTVLDLVASAEVTELQARAYVRALLRAGYVVAGARLRHGCMDRRGGEFVLLRHTGAHAPLVTRHGLYDLNRRCRVPWLATGSDA